MASAAKFTTGAKCNETINPVMDGPKIASNLPSPNAKPIPVDLMAGE